MGGTYALRTPIGILVFGALLAAGVYLLRRQTLREFPDAASTLHLRTTLATAAGGVRLWASSKEAATSRRMGRHRSTAEELAHLADLHNSGALTDEEFARAKAHILP